MTNKTMHDFSSVERKPLVVGKKPLHCPVCHGVDILPIKYGFLRQRDDDDTSPHEPFIAGGCNFSLDSPGWGCRSCDAKFSGSPDLFRTGTL